MRLLVGNMRFRALVLTKEDMNEADDLYYTHGEQRYLRSAIEKEAYGNGGKKEFEELKLWGLTLGMTLLVSSITPGSHYLIIPNSC